MNKFQKVLKTEEYNKVFALLQVCYPVQMVAQGEEGDKPILDFKL